MITGKYKEFGMKLRITALSLALLIMMFAYINGYSGLEPFDCEGPSGEAIQLEKNHENERNREAFDRINRDEAEKGDAERAWQYIRENVVLHWIDIEYATPVIGQIAKVYDEETGKAIVDVYLPVRKRTISPWLSAKHRRFWTPLN
jgi:hypothetical protein